jgi:hypothetical protein
VELNVFPQFTQYVCCEATPPYSDSWPGAGIEVVDEHLLHAIVPDEVQVGATFST